MEYPVVKIPESFLALKNHQLLYPKKPEIPKKPQKPELLNEDNEGCLQVVAYFMFLPIVMGFFLFFGNLFAGDSEDFGLGALFLFGGLIVFWIFKPTDKNKKENENRMKKYQLDLFQFNTNVLPKYQSELEVYNKKVELLSNHEFRGELAEKRFWQSLVKSSKPQLADKEGNKGVTEEMFYKLLRSRFKTKILVGYSVNKDENPLGYIPDFIYYDSKKGLCVDIEIDEPYEGKTNKPIHYIGSDDSRDEFFLSKNWIVIRFAEEQIVKQPNSCVNFIAKIINDYFPEIEVDSKTEELLLIKRWTKQEAEIMAFKLYRNSYIPLSSISKLQIESNKTKHKRGEEKTSRFKSDLAQDDDLPF